MVKQSFTNTEFGVLLCSGFEVVVITNLIVKPIRTRLKGLNYEKITVTIQTWD